MLAGRSIPGRSVFRPIFYSLWLRELRASSPLRYLVGIGAALLVSLIRIALNPVWGTSFPYIFFFPTTLFSALYGGAGPACAGIAICAIMTLVWVLPPTGVLVVSDRLDVFGLIVIWRPTASSLGSGRSSRSDR